MLRLGAVRRGTSLFLCRQASKEGSRAQSALVKKSQFQKLPTVPKRAAFQTIPIERVKGWQHSK
ncbi:arginine kinase-like [Drosophila madeirensis]|uniref:Arginine kinase-like n=1 Tax=Drosophila madeirensis TaxID=30013 RepID=A0AAU9FUK3_DROMD